ncbi:MAG TPA: AI-2E family transporter [Patescibacteria group bacterium]|nr:AI-2E family transporter [Patescibacteria group bacterium]
MSTSSQRAPTPVLVSSYALGFIVFCLITYILYVAAAILIPLVIAVFVWYLINAMARGLSRMKLGGSYLPRFLCFLLAILALVGGLWFVYKLISVNAAEVVRAAPVYQKKLMAFLPRLMTGLPPEYQMSPAELGGFLDIGGFIKSLVQAFTGIAGKAVIVLFYTGFLLYEQQFFGRKLAEMMREKASEARVHKTIKNIETKIQRYIWVKTLVSAVAGISTWILLTAFKINFSEFWGVMAFILHFIPFAGAIAAVVLPSVAALVQLGDMGDMTQLVTLMLALTSIQVFCTSFLDPRLTGDSLDLSPIVIISAIGAWGVLWGVPGMFLAVPILSAAVIIMSQFDNTKPMAILMSKTGDIASHGHTRQP